MTKRDKTTVNKTRKYSHVLQQFYIFYKNKKDLAQLSNVTGIKAFILKTQKAGESNRKC